MRPLLLRRPDLDRRLVALWAGAVLTAVAIIAVMTARAGGGGAHEAPPEEVATSPTATATPAFVLPPLPAGCQFLGMLHPGLGLRVGEPTAFTMEAQDCVARAWEAVPVERLAGELRLEVTEPDAPAQLLVPLTPSIEGAVLRWRGEVTYPLGGTWRGWVSVAGQPVVSDVPLSWQVAGEPGLMSRPGLPLPALEHELTVLNIDRPGEPARWRSLDGWGMAWIPGAAPGEAARVVWVQAREGREWVVAGDPTTGVVTPLFEVEMPASLHGAPDGRAFVVVDRWYGAPKRIRFYDAQRSRLVDVGTSRLDPRPVSWAPDSSAVIVGGDRPLLLASNGVPRSFDASSFVENVAWAADSTWGIAVLRGANPAENDVVKIDVASGTTARLVTADASDRLLVSPGPVISPDGRRFALAWWDSSAPAGNVAVFDRDEPLPLSLEDHTVASYPIAGASAKLQWLTTMTWSPDGSSLLFSMFTPTNGQLYPAATSIQVLDVASKAVRFVVQPRQGHYAYGPVWVSADGRALFKQWHSCVACDGGDSGIDIVDLSSGAIVRTIARGISLGAIDGVRHVLSSPDGLLTVRGLEPPRLLMAGRWSAATSFIATPSPDGNRLAVRQESGRMTTVVAAAPDGSTQTTLGYVRPEARLVGVRDATTAFVLDYQAGWAWSSFDNGAVTPLPQQGDARLETALETAGAISPDRSVVGYWAPGAAKPEVLLQLLDLKTGAVASSLATSRQTKGMSLAMSKDGTRVAFSDNEDIVTVDVPMRAVRRIPLQGLRDSADHSPVSTLAAGPGGTFEVVAGQKLWRIDPASGDAQAVTDQQPSPGGWRSQVELSRSPDERRLVALTAFGLFELQADGSWRLVSGVGAERFGPEVSSIVWSPDSNRIAYLAGGPRGPGELGIVVVGLDGSGAYELVKRAIGREMKVLDWLPDGRIVYALITRGL